MDDDALLKRFALARIARLATHGPEDTLYPVPHVVPVPFAVFGDMVGVVVDHQSNELAAVQNLHHNGHVSLLVDHYSDRNWSQRWWIRVDGVVERWPALVDDYRLYGTYLQRKYVQFDERPPAGRFLLISISRLVGWSYEGE